MTADENTAAVIDSLMKLERLKSSGTITEDEFNKLKSELMDRPQPAQERSSAETTRLFEAPRQAPPDTENIRRYADTVFGSFTPEIRTAPAEKRDLAPQVGYDFRRGADDARKRSARTVSSVKSVSVQNLIADINNSLNNIREDGAAPAPKRTASARTAPTERPPVQAAEKLPEKSPPKPEPIIKDNDIFQDITSGIDFSLDDTSAAAAVIPDDAGADSSFRKRSPQNDTPEDMTAGVNFSLYDTSPVFRDDPSMVPPRKKKARLIDEITEKFVPMRSIYERRNNALMNAESKNDLGIIPIFAVGAAAAVFFYYVLVILLGVSATLEVFLLLFCFWAGVAPACVIIPNSVAAGIERKKATEADAQLRGYYDTSGFTQIPYELSDPYILEYLAENTDDGDLENIRSAAAELMESFTDEETARVKKQADTASSDDTAARAASMYVLAKRMSAGGAQSD